VLNNDMRDLLDQLILIESTGLAGRKPGDVFKSPSGNQIVFKKLDFYPQQGGILPKDNLDQILKDLGLDINWQNSRSPKTGGVAVATFDSDQGEVRYGFYKNDIKANRTDNKIPNQVGEYRFAGKAAEKIQSGLTPQDLLSQRDNLTSESIIAQLSEKLGPENSLVQLTQRIAGGEKFPIRFAAPEGLSFTGFRDYFCEILQPIALQVGSYTGNAAEAAEQYMDGSFGDSLISFDESKNAGLSDSILTKSDGKYVKISTKGGAGAQASVKNLTDSIRELEQTPNGTKLLEKYKDTIEIVNTVSELGQVNAPLYLGQKYGIIDDTDANTIRKLRGAAPINLDNIDQMNISDNLKKLAKERETDDPQNVNLFYHLLASIAHLAAIEVNDKTDFSKAAADILNNGALIQVYTEASQGIKEWELTEFNTVYPGTSIKGVFFSAGKTYFSTGIKGNFTFKIDRGGKKFKEKEQKPERKKKEPELAKAADILTKGSGLPLSMARNSGQGVGREKQEP